jgi:hypothetical protein
VITYTHSLEAFRDRVTIRPVAVLDQVVWCFIPREGIGDLVGDPLCVGLAVTLSDINRRSCLRIIKTKSSRKPTVGTMRKSMAATPAELLWRKVFQVCDRPLFAMYLATVD